MTRVAVLIDGNNIFHSARQISREVDYSLLREFLVGNDELVRTFFYTGVEEGADRQRGFLHWMRRNGFRVISKAVKLEKDGTRRAHLETEITTDLVSIANYVDRIVLVSGNEDFAYPIQAISQLGVRVEVAGFRDAMANKLLDSADLWIELKDDMPIFKNLSRAGDWREAED